LLEINVMRALGFERNLTTTRRITVVIISGFSASNMAIWEG
jgi:hypothetical protein